MSRKGERFAAEKAAAQKAKRTVGLGMSTGAEIKNEGNSLLYEFFRCADLSCGRDLMSFTALRLL